MGRLIKLSRWRLGCHMACKAIPKARGTRCNRISVMELISRVRGDSHPSDPPKFCCSAASSLLPLAVPETRVPRFNLKFFDPSLLPPSPPRRLGRANLSCRFSVKRQARTSCRYPSPNLKRSFPRKGRSKNCNFVACVGGPRARYSK